MIIVITGPQGSGKGEQAKILEKEFGFKHLSTGNIIRDEIKAGTPDGKAIESYVKQGKFTPNEINNRLLERALEKYKDKTIILDGYPRYIEQADHLFKIADVKAMILLKVSDGESMKRMMNRRICTANNKIYIADQVTPQDVEECRKLGGEIIQRNDDQPEPIKKRLDDYKNETTPVIDHFKKHKIPVLEIDGEHPIEEVAAAIKKRVIEAGLDK
ncbi:MAG: adenylate kinase family protein [Candidatus Nanoarchaeia archaeon]